MHNQNILHLRFNARIFRDIYLYINGARLDLEFIERAINEREEVGTRARVWLINTGNTLTRPITEIARCLLHSILRRFY